MRRGGVGGGSLMSLDVFRTGSTPHLKHRHGLAIRHGSPTTRCRCRSRRLTVADLSPAAQALVKACSKARDAALDEEDMLGLAAALRAAADQVVPWKPEPTEESVGPTIDFGFAWALFSKANDVRQELLAIADELEAQ